MTRNRWRTWAATAAAATLAATALAACNSAPTQTDAPAAPASEASATGGMLPTTLRHDWRVTRIGTQAVTSTGAREAHIAFDGQQPRATGNSTCNGFGADYTVSGQQLQFGPAMGTKMACAGSMEREFMQALQAVRGYQAKGQHMQLLDASGQVLMELVPR